MALLARGAGCRSRCAGRCPATPPTRQARYHRGGDRRRPLRLDLPAERESPARTEVRLQARLVRAPDRARRGAARRAAIRWCWPATSTSCRPSATSIRRRSYRDNALLQPEPRQAYAAPPRAGLDRRDPRPPSRGDDLHLLGLPAQSLAAQRRAAHRPPAAERERRRAGCATAGVDRDERGREWRQRPRPGLGASWPLPERAGERA